MNVVIPTIGTRGDVQPYIALALGLGKAGHTVTLATHPCMRGLVESYGVPFAPVGPDVDIGHEAAVIRARSPHWMLDFMRVMRFTLHHRPFHLGRQGRPVGRRPTANFAPQAERRAHGRRPARDAIPEMRAQAADLGAAIRAEPDGVEEAVRLIEQHIARFGGNK